MSTVYELVYHKELNMFSRLCRYMGVFHHCTRKMRGFIKIMSCPTDCNLCEKETGRKEYKPFAGQLTETATLCVDLVMAS